MQKTANKTFSIITPSYNAGEKIEKTIKSIVSQNENLYEYIIVDGGSTDNTIPLIIHYQNKFPDNIRFISEPDNGIFDAMNKGIGLSVGEYLYFIGAGDCLMPGVLDQIAQHAEPDKHIIYGDVVMYPRGSRHGKELTKYNIFANIPCHQQLFYNKRLFDRLGIYNTDYSIFADTAFNILCWSDESINKKYVDFVIASYAGSGLSSSGRDERFAKDFKDIIIKKYGYENYINNCCLANTEFYTMARHVRDLKVVVVARDWMVPVIAKDIQSFNTMYGNNTQILKTFLLKDFKEFEYVNEPDIDYFIIGGNSIKDVLLIKIYLMKMGIPDEKILINTCFRLGIWEGLERTDIRNVIIFGTGSCADYLTNYIKNNKKNINIKCYFDNDVKKSDTEFFGRPVMLPNTEQIDENTHIIVASTFDDEITRQLKQMGVNQDKIIA